MNTNQQLFAKLRAKFAAFYTTTGAIHEDILKAGKPTNGHGRDHDLMVAQYAAIIAEDEHVGELAWLAALIHSFDRHFSADEARTIVLSCLNSLETILSEEDILIIERADENHSKPNEDTDGPVVIALKDGDRLANLGLANLIRGGQHRPNIPACLLEWVDRMHPDSTFRKPVCGLDAVRYNLEWWDMLRSDKARELGRPSFEYMRAGLKLEEDRVREVGLFLLVEEAHTPKAEVGAV